MLIISRKVEQTFVCDGGIEVKVLEIRNNRVVRLGITAPDDTAVHRGEVQRRMLLNKLDPHADGPAKDRPCRPE